MYYGKYNTNNEEFKRKSVKGKRLYENPSGDPTRYNYSRQNKTGESPALQNWRKRVGEEKAQQLLLKPT